MYKAIPLKTRNANHGWIILAAYMNLPCTAIFHGAPDELF
jgi:hypothetical protein